MVEETEKIQSLSQQWVNETRQRIVYAATQVFSEKGYAGATTRSIAARAGVNEVTLFRHFGNKKNLLIAVLEKQLRLGGLESFEKQFTGDYYQDLLNLGRNHLEQIIQGRETVLMMLSEVKHLPEVHKIIAQMPNKLRQMLGKYIRQQIKRGIVRELDPELAAQVFFGMFFWYGINQPLLDKSSDKVSLDTVVNQFVDIFVEGTIKRET
jgi:AcrR family transcriptional regulator